MSKTLKWILGLYLVVMGAALTFYMVLQKHSRSPRNPASENMAMIPFEVTANETENLIKLIKLRVLQQLTVRATEEGHQVRLGAIALRTSEGLQHLCQMYPSVEIHLRAQGVMVSGKSPEIVITTHCRPHTSREVLEPISLPWHSLSMNEPQNAKYDIDRGGSLATRFIDDFWPEQWFLAAIKFKNAKTKAEINIDSYEIAYVHGETVILK